MGWRRLYYVGCHKRLTSNAQNLNKREYRTITETHTQGAHKALGYRKWRAAKFTTFPV